MSKKDAFQTSIAPVVANQIERTQINKFHTKGGTGFAAEEANALHDKLQGGRVNQVGISNELNGPDRVVNDIKIQTKYFDTPAKTVNAAFNSSDGVFRYKGQQIEVPSDQYDTCIRLMQEKISQGRVLGVSDPVEAKNIIKKGHVTYKQARNIARAGNIDSLLFDAKTQCVTTSYILAIAFSVNFAQRVWSGETRVEALKESFNSAICSGTSSFITGIVTSQILRTKVAAIGHIASRDGVKYVAQSEIGKKAIGKIAHVSLGKAVYGAASVNHVAKLLRSNVITSAITTVVVTAPDFYRAAISRNISWTQFSKNFAVNAAGVASGSAGWIAGTAMGASLGSAVPIVGTVIGGVAGGLIGALVVGAGGGIATKAVLDKMIEDDAKEMLHLTNEALEQLAFDYLLSKEEAEEFLKNVKDEINLNLLRRVYKIGEQNKSNSREARVNFVYEELESECNQTIKKRSKIFLPKNEEIDQIIVEIEKQLEKTESFLSGDFEINDGILETEK